MEQDWSNAKSVFTLGSSAFTDKERVANDYYATEPKAVKALLEVEKFSPKVWECACGEGHISEVLKSNGYEVCSTDLINRGYGDVFDFLDTDDNNSYNHQHDCDIITNPPYKYALEFCERSINLVDKGHKVAMFLRLQFLESKRRKAFFQKFPPKTVYVSASRLRCARNGKFEDMTGNAVAYAWFVWEKGFTGTTSLKWIN